MRTVIYSDIKGPAARVLGVCSTSSEVLEKVNEAQERLLNRANDPVGSFMRYKVCVGSSDCVVFPRQIRTIQQFWICNEPGIVRNMWFEAIGWNEGGYGMFDSDSHPGTMLIDRGMACSFDNVIATTAEPRKIQAVAADASDNGKKITLRYIDSNGNRKYSTIDGSVQEGEELTLSTSGVLTSSNVATNGLYHVVKASTNHPVRLYSYDVNSAAQSALLAVYEPSETVPVYRKMFIPGLTDMAACSGAEDEDCTVNKSLTVLAKLTHVKVVNDNDPLVIGNLPALKLMVKGIKMQEQNYFDEAERLFASAAAEIDGEIASYLGDAVVAVKMQDTELFGGGGILNAI